MAYIIIAGAGIVGRNLTRSLVENHDVVVIDIDRQVCEDIYTRYGAVSVHGNATRVDVLKDAGIETCDIAVSVMRNDADNLAFTVLARDFGVEKILVRMREPDYESAYLKAGATTVGSIMELMVEKFIIDIEQPRVRRVASLGDGRAEISIVTIPPDSRFAGQTVSDIVNSPQFPDDIVIAGIYDTENDLLNIPRGNREIHGNNQVFLVGTGDNVHRAADALMEKTRKKRKR